MNIAEIKKIAALSRIEIGDDKLDAFADEFNKILEYFKKLDEAPAEGIEAFSFEEKNIFRVDEPRIDGDVRQRILENAPERQGDFFKVKKIIENH